MFYSRKDRNSGLDSVTTYFSTNNKRFTRATNFIFSIIVIMFAMICGHLIYKKLSRNKKLNNFLRKIKRKLFKKKRNPANHSDEIDAAQFRTKHSSTDNKYKYIKDSDTESSEDDLPLKQIKEIKLNTKNKNSGRKNYGRGTVSKVHRSLDPVVKSALSTLVNDSKFEPSNALITKSDKEIYYMIQQNNVIAELTIHPELPNMLESQEIRVLKHLCENGRVLRGKSKGKNGIFFVNDAKKYANHPLKLKNCSEQIRFFATKKSEAEQNTLARYEVDAYLPDHKKRSQIVTVS